MSRMKLFWSDEDGAVTVDWVVLTAAILAFSVVVGSAIREPLADKTDSIANDVAAAG